MTLFEGTGATSDGVDPGIRPAMPMIDARTTALGSCAACIEQSLLRPGTGLWWCIGHMAPAPCPQVHSALCVSAWLTHNATGTSATVPTWHDSHIRATGAS